MGAVGWREISMKLNALSGTDFYSQQSGNWEVLSQCSLHKLRERWRDFLNDADAAPLQDFLMIQLNNLGIAMVAALHIEADRVVIGFVRKAELKKAVLVQRRENALVCKNPFGQLVKRLVPSICKEHQLAYFDVAETVSVNKRPERLWP